MLTLSKTEMVAVEAGAEVVLVAVEEAVVEEEEAQDPRRAVLAMLVAAPADPEVHRAAPVDPEEQRPTVRHLARRVIRIRRVS